MNNNSNNKVFVVYCTIHFECSSLTNVASIFSSQEKASAFMNEKKNYTEMCDEVYEYLYHRKNTFYSVLDNIVTLSEGLSEEIISAFAEKLKKVYDEDSIKGIEEIPGSEKLEENDKNDLINDYLSSFNCFFNKEYFVEEVEVR